MNYDELNLHKDLAKGISHAGYVKCTPIQAETFAKAFSGVDIYAQSQTGTGKTAAFLVSIFQQIMTKSDCRNKKTLILAPTRELAVQIETEAKKLAAYLPISIGSFYGGVSYDKQLDMLSKDVQVIIGTPGRIIDLVKHGKMLFTELGFLVIDEADRMFDMGFIDDLRTLLRYLPPIGKRQTFLFSATLNFRIKNLAWEYMNNPKEISIISETVTVDLVTQELYHVSSDEKFKLLLGLLDREKPASALIFCNQKYMVQTVAKKLKNNAYNCEYIMGDLPQSKRLKIIDSLKSGKLSLLIATDVAARGLDVNGLDLVINYDLPNEPELYVHRIGRTARAGASGKAISLACEKFVYGLAAIEKYIEFKIPVKPIADELLLEDKSHKLAGKDLMQKQNSKQEKIKMQKVPKSAPKKDARKTLTKKDNIDTYSKKAIRGTAPKTEQIAHKRNKNSAKNYKPEIGKHDPYAKSMEERMKSYKQKYAPSMPQNDMPKTKTSPIVKTSIFSKIIKLISKIKQFF